MENENEVRRMKGNAENISILESEQECFSFLLGWVLAPQVNYIKVKVYSLVETYICILFISWINLIVYQILIFV